MRNELVEELSVDPEEKILQSRTGSPSEMGTPSGGRAKQAEERKRWDRSEEKGMELHPEKQAYPGRGNSPLSRRAYAVASPSEVAKAAGTPKSLLMT